jgi:hypothetical protein
MAARTGVRAVFSLDHIPPGLEKLALPFDPLP